MTITDDELKAMAVELCLLRGEQPKSVDRGGVERWERYKPLAEGALREAERLFALRQSSPPDGQTAGDGEPLVVANLVREIAYAAAQFVATDDRYWREQMDYLEGQLRTALGGERPSPIYAEDVAREINSRVKP